TSAATMTRGLAARDAAPKRSTPSQLTSVTAGGERERRRAQRLEHEEKRERDDEVDHVVLALAERREHRERQPERGERAERDVPMPRPMEEEQSPRRVHRRDAVAKRPLRDGDPRRHARRDDLRKIGERVARAGRGDDREQEKARRAVEAELAE